MYVVHYCIRERYSVAYVRNFFIKNKVQQRCIFDKVAVRCCMYRELLYSTYNDPRRTIIACRLPHQLPQQTLTTTTVTDSQAMGPWMNV